MTGNLPGGRGPLEAHTPVNLGGSEDYPGATGMATRLANALLERESELALAAQLLSAAADGTGRMLAIEGEAGIGKTALLERTCELAGERGFLVLRARGGELEREFPHGVVRQLFEDDLRKRPAEERRGLLSGAAKLAAPIVSPTGDGARTQPSGDPFSIAHALYWLTSNLADRQPLLVAVDDVQWSDAVSLRFLAHLARRLEGLALLLTVCIRTGEPAGDEVLTSELTAGTDTTVLHPARLSQDGVGRLIAYRLGERADPDFAAACHEATGGTPFLVGELTAELQAREIQPTSDAASAVGTVVPQAVARTIMARLRRLPSAALKLARAVALLGTDARLHRAAQLANVSEDDAATAAEGLTSMSILRPGLPLEFVHPIVRETVYDDMSAATRATGHARAADLLSEERAELDAIAGHLLLCEPGSSAETVERLRKAAAHAAGRGAPESATVYLRRALAEAGQSAEQRAECLLELARAERYIEPKNAIAHLREAHEVAATPGQRVRIAYELADVLLLRPGHEDTVPLMDAAITEAEDVDPDVAVQLEAVRFQQSLFDVKWLPSALERLPSLRVHARSDSRSGRMTAILLASSGAAMGWPTDEVAELLRMGMPGGHLPPDEEPDSWVMIPMFNAHALLDALDDGLRASDEMIARARQRGSIVAVTIALGGRQWMNARRGDLVSVEADLRAILDLVEEHELTLVGTGAARWLATDAMLERPQLADQAAESIALEITSETKDLFVRAMLLEMRGRLRLAAGDIPGGIGDLRQCAEVPGAKGNPNQLGWRPALALALARTEPHEALDLARRELKRAERFGMPRAIGRALRVLGLIEGGDEGIARMEEAVAILERSPARLEHARALVDLGAARRRAGQRADAREPLRKGMDLAHRCGATRLQQRAREELAATGARPRSVVLTGRDALTATEQRVAQLAAEGMSNPEIAQALFVTRKTVENHLGRIYPKLGIHTRELLPQALQEPEH